MTGVPTIAPVKRALWRIARPDAVRELQAQVDALSPDGAKGWYYHLDFGMGVQVRPELARDPHAGEANWRFLAEHLPALRGKRVLDVGSNAGLYALRMLDGGAREVVGIELDTAQAEFTRARYAELEGKDFSAARFVAADARSIDMAQYGEFDLTTAFCVIYHLADGAEHVIEQFSRVSATCVLQGNLPRTHEGKYDGRGFQDLAGIEGMQGILARHGFTEQSVVAPQGHPKPLVIGRKPEVR